MQTLATVDQEGRQDAGEQSCLWDARSESTFLSLGIRQTILTNIRRESRFLSHISVSSLSSTSLSTRYLLHITASGRQWLAYGLSSWASRILCAPSVAASAADLLLVGSSATAAFPLDVTFSGASGGSPSEPESGKCGEGAPMLPSSSFRDVAYSRI